MKHSSCEGYPLVQGFQQTLFYNAKRQEDEFGNYHGVRFTFRNSK